MARRMTREMTVEEFEAWSAASRRTDAVAQRADEGGGPRLSLVPVPEQHDAWPTDLLAPAPDPDSDAATPGAPPMPVMPTTESAPLRSAKLMKLITRSLVGESSNDVVDFAQR